MQSIKTLGVIGGTGELGSSLIRGFLEAGVILPENLWVSNRSGQNDSLQAWPNLNFTTDNQFLVDHADIIILSVPPALFANLRVAAADKLIISVMAGVSSAQIADQTGAARIVKAISNPAAHLGYAYSAYYAPSDLSQADRDQIELLFSSCGIVDQVMSEDHVDRFTAMTGPVPGYVAYFADALSQYAQKQGIPEAVANRAVRQLFAGSGRIFESSEKAPGTMVQDMIDYAGTTAAGLNALKSTPLVEEIHKGVEAAYQRTKTIG